MPDGPGRFAQDYSCPALLRIPLRPRTLRIRGSHPLWRNFPGPSPHDYGPTARSYYPGMALLPHRFGLFPVRSPLLGESLVYFLFLEVLRCFSSPGSPPAKGRVDMLHMSGFSHSEINGSKVICTYPSLIAAYHVLRRLNEPRHPPFALSYFL